MFPWGLGGPDSAGGNRQASWTAGRRRAGREGIRDKREGRVAGSIRYSHQVESDCQKGRSVLRPYGYGRRRRKLR